MVLPLYCDDVCGLSPVLPGRLSPFVSQDSWASSVETINAALSRGPQFPAPRWLLPLLLALVVVLLLAAAGAFGVSALGWVAFIALALVVWLWPCGLAWYSAAVSRTVRDAVSAVDADWATRQLRVRWSVEETSAASRGAATWLNVEVAHVAAFPVSLLTRVSRAQQQRQPQHSQIHPSAAIEAGGEHQRAEAGLRVDAAAPDARFPHAEPPPRASLRPCRCP